MATTRAIAESTSAIPATAIGLMHDPDEAAKLIRRMERGIPKRPPAAWERRPVGDQEAAKTAPKAGALVEFCVGRHCS
jgi:hypothetical protein